MQANPPRPVDSWGVRLPSAQSLPLLAEELSSPFSQVLQGGGAGQENISQSWDACLSVIGPTGLCSPM